MLHFFTCGYNHTCICIWSAYLATLSNVCLCSPMLICLYFLMFICVGHVYSVKPLGFSFYKWLAFLLATKWDNSYFSVMDWLECCLSFSLLRSSLWCLLSNWSVCKDVPCYLPCQGGSVDYISPKRSRTYHLMLGVVGKGSPLNLGKKTKQNSATGT